VPDLITHVAAAHLIRRPFEVGGTLRSDVHDRYFFYLGAMLPDLTSRPWYILFPRIHDWVLAFHTPVGALLWCGFLSLLFRRGLRRRMFLWGAGGAALHLGLDCLQKQVVGNNYWLFPFSWNNFGFGLFWAGEAIPFIPVWIGLVILFEAAVWRIRRNRPSRPDLTAPAAR
jgi:hypothetical protein